MKRVLIHFVGFIVGAAVGYMVCARILTAWIPSSSDDFFINPLGQSKEVVGFLPYWLEAKADKDYTRYVTTLAYFGLTISPDGTIQKRIKPTESEPGWYALTSGKMDHLLTEARRADKHLSLVAFSADQEAISQLIGKPVQHARALVGELEPIMKQYGFTELNLDIESVEPASDEARSNFTVFVTEIKRQLDAKKLGSLTIDVSPTALIKTYLIDVPRIVNLVDRIIFMTYDYHYQGSSVTGAVSPLQGGGNILEFDTEQAIHLALNTMPEHKILIGAPLYGYEWETIEASPSAAVIPGTGLTASNRRIESFMSSCATCSAVLDDVTQESYLIYQDKETGSYHQFFYPDKNSMQKKVELVNTLHVGGIAVWALGYEGDNILEPLKTLVGSH